MNKLVLLLTVSVLTACSLQEKPDVAIDVVDGRPHQVSIDIATIPDAVPQYEPWSSSVNPKKYTVLGKEYQVLSTNKGYMKQGIASWYGTKFHQHKTATGEDYDMFAMTAAHKTLPIPSYVRVTNLDNQQTVIVRVNDRGPFHEHRIIDLSYAAAVKLGLEKAGTGFVEVVAVQPGEVSSALPTAQAKHVYLQIGAFGEQKNALTLQQRFAELRLTTSRIVDTQTPERIVYKVQAGPVISVVEADEIVEKIKNIGVYNSHFISE
ncbi:MAG: septal ring lytic transglycosylase RlpA family protein [Methyloprofundus sp.]|nr:septal ring lytic transglycosylase RlpA family protein [Methyloprofundus sp.]MBW6453595.1 septal ring lytic transglycosylase RlpA family protein [Methyloprofundus sp.]